MIQLFIYNILYICKQQIKPNSMRKSLTLVSLVIITLTLISCGTPSTDNQNTKTSTSFKSSHNLSDTPDPTVIDQYYVAIDTANEMLQSFANGNNGFSEDSDSISSFIINADALRYYLANPDVKEIKISLAHNRDYTYSEKQNTYAGYKSDALALIISGISAEGNYVIPDNGKVMNKSIPCPKLCATGTASTNLIIH